MIRRLATITSTAIAAIALAACSTSTPRATAAHPGAGPSLAAQLAAPATCDHVRIARWGVATCRAWDRLDARQRAVFSGPPVGGVIMSISFPTTTTVTVDDCARGVPTSSGAKQAWPGTEWVALQILGKWNGHTWVPGKPQIAGFSCADV
ncbi:MAG: hypothetical protein M1522_02320 [Actinobacteria bacterium]|nr:hypothetical protein [Actinomycetota bacterium]